jgi:hypothetical protein
MPVLILTVAMSFVIFCGYYYSVDIMFRLWLLYTTGTCRLRWLRAGRRFSWPNADDYGTPSHAAANDVGLVSLSKMI